MKESINKFKSNSAFEQWKSNDGWSYPSVSFIEGKNGQTSVKYNSGSRELIMRWYDADPVKKLYFMGNMSRPEFQEWLANAWAPCEIRRNGTEFNYLLRSDIRKTATSFSGSTQNGSNSHLLGPVISTINASGHEIEYLQLVELKNINVGLFQNSVEGYKEVRFNFDKGCPEGFHRWFAHPYWNESIEAYTKLVGRYDITAWGGALGGEVWNAPATSEGTYFPTCNSISYNEASVYYNIGTSDGSIISCFESTEIIQEDYSSSWSPRRLFCSCRAVSDSIQPWTYWEQLVLRYIAMAATDITSEDIYQSSSVCLNYLGGDDITGVYSDGNTIYPEDIYPGIVEESNSFNLYNDIFEFASTGTYSESRSYSFLGIQDALHGKLELCCAQAGSDGSKYFFSYDDITSNHKYGQSIEESDVVVPLKKISNSWISDMDIYGMPISGGASSTTGFMCNSYVNTATAVNEDNPTRCILVGGSMAHGYDGRSDVMPDINYCSLLGYDIAAPSIRGRLTFIRS